jgi:hypothetical protein
VRVSVLARALVMVAYNLVVFPNVQLARKYALIFTNGIQALWATGFETPAGSSTFFFFFFGRFGRNKHKYVS